MDSTSRRWFLAAAAATVIAVVAFATCRRDGTPPVPGDGAPSAAGRTPPKNKPRHGDAADGPDATVNPSASENGNVPEDDGYPYVDVDVVQHDRTLAPSTAIVYALHAGTTTDGEPPSAYVVDGRARLHVPRPGRYDVGAMDGGLAALAKDVDVPRAGPLLIQLPEAAEVVLRADPPVVPDDPKWPGAQFRVEAEGESVARFPGRGQQIRWTLGGLVEQTTKKFGVVVAKGATGRVRFDSRDVVAVPAAFTAPATLRVVRAGGYPLTLRIAFESPGASFPRGAVLRADFLVGDVTDPTATWTARLGPDESVGAAAPPPVSLRADANAPEGTIAWKGAGVLPGSQAFTGLVRDAENVVDVTLRLTPTAPKEERPASLPARNVGVRATGGDEPGLPAQVRLIVCDGRGFVASSDAAPGADATFTVTDAAWALATRGNWAADPVRLGAVPQGAGAALTLRAGGSLVVSLDRRPPPSLGAVVIRRKDGAPFLVQDGALSVFAARTWRSLVLGPFPEGGVDFVFELSGEVVGETRAQVRAGAQEKLRIPSLAPR